MSLLTHTSANGHSADVRMTLRVNGDMLDIAQMGPNFLILREPADHPPSTAEVTLIVDGHEDRWTLQLPEGLKPTHTRVPVTECRPATAVAG